MSKKLEWKSDNEFTIDDTSYLCRAKLKEADTAPGQLGIFKGRSFVEGYAALVERLQPRNMFELGILAGGSTAFLAQIAQPDRFVAVDLSDTPVEILETFIDAHQMRDRVRPYYGVDQSDTARLREIVAREFGDEPLDLVIDDVSHLVHETRTSFNVLFPRLRPGGLFLIEDWSWAHRGVVFSGKKFQHRFVGATPLSVLVFEIALASAYAPDVIASVEVHLGWTTVTRGPAAIDGSWDLSACLDGVGRAMIEKLEA